MSSNAAEPLTLETLQDGVRGSAAIRVVATLEPAGGPGDKVFPPTYQGGRYHTEMRRIADREVPCVVLDSVQSQANRMELALKHAYEREELKFPLVVSDFSATELPHIGRITALDAPHRIADAIFRESELNGSRFRDSEEGRSFTEASPINATPIFELCPTALVFGVWDSTGPRGGLGTKFARALASEIIGLDAQVGSRSASRVDPLPISREVTIFEAKDGWTLDQETALKDSAGNPRKIKRKGEGEGTPAVINLGNYPPSLVADKRTGELLPGGVTISSAVQTAVLSLSALRRLRFPLEDGGGNGESDDAARAVLASLGLAAVAYQHADGYDLRSRCVLVPAQEPSFEFVPAMGGAPTRFSCGIAEASSVFAAAVTAARDAGLPWRDEEIVLTPSERLVELVRRSEEVLAQRPAEEAEQEEN
jgi:CRISPR-associated protein Csb1